MKPIIRKMVRSLSAEEVAVLRKEFSRDDNEAVEFMDTMVTELELLEEEIDPAYVLDTMCEGLEGQEADALANWMATVDSRLVVEAFMVRLNAMFKNDPKYFQKIHKTVSFVD